MYVSSCFGDRFYCPHCYQPTYNDNSYAFIYLIIVNYSHFVKKVYFLKSLWCEAY